MSAGCALYSVVGILFCFWVSVLLAKQPFFITGIDDFDTARENANGAMGLFVVTLAYSLYKIYFPTKEDTIDTSGPEGYQLNTGATEYGSY
mmetsp:Transcript_17177/g.20985  ORF Transcript_17177/g.20985 Transcript_17177/m.20985 type:complete len:91 (+) Transcript_17177:140-412(+)